MSHLYNGYLINDVGDSTWGTIEQNVLMNLAAKMPIPAKTIVTYQHVHSGLVVAGGNDGGGSADEIAVSGARTWAGFNTCTWTGTQPYFNFNESGVGYFKIQEKFGSGQMTANDGTGSIYATLNNQTPGLPLRAFVVTNADLLVATTKTIGFNNGATLGPSLSMGTGNPATTPAQGSLYIKTDATSATDRIWVRTAGAWAYLTTSE